jgi:hypothetical protein
LRVDPPTATVEVESGRPAMQAFRAFGKLPGGAEQEVTTSVTWFVNRPALVPQIADGLATTSDSAGGVVLVTASTSTLVSGSATLNIKLPADPSGVFGGPGDDKRAPQLVYPNDGVVVPPNLNGIEVHFRPGSTSNTLFEIGFANALTNVTVYTRCVTLGDGCVYRPDSIVWAQLAETNRGAGTVTITVRGTDDTGTAVGHSASARMGFTKDDLKGGLYYWTTTHTSIERWDFGSKTQTTPETVVSPADGDGKTCVGCHALSRDGKRLVATLGGQGDGRILLWDISAACAAIIPIGRATVSTSSSRRSTRRTGTAIRGRRGQGSATSRRRARGGVRPCRSRRTSPARTGTTRRCPRRTTSSCSTSRPAPAACRASSATPTPTRRRRSTRCRCRRGTRNRRCS